MQAKVTISKDGAQVARIYNAQRFDLVRGTVADVELTGVQGRVDWSADNDEVLEIQDDAGFTAKVKATAVGISTIELKQRGRPIGILRIEVYEDNSNEAVGFASTVGPEIPD